MLKQTSSVSIIVRKDFQFTFTLALYTPTCYQSPFYCSTVILKQKIKKLAITYELLRIHNHLFFSKPVNHIVYVCFAFQLTLKSILFVHLCVSVLTPEQM